MLMKRLLHMRCARVGGVGWREVDNVFSRFRRFPVDGQTIRKRYFHYVFSKMKTEAFENASVWKKPKTKCQDNVARARRVVSFHLLSFSPIQWLIRDFKNETFRDQWIPLTQYLKFQWNKKAKEDYKPEKNGPGLSSSECFMAEDQRFHLKCKPFGAIIALWKLFLFSKIIVKNG